MPIIKVLTRSSAGSYGSLVNYLMREGKGKDGGTPILLTHNMRGSTKDEFVQSFMENESWRKYSRSDAIKMYHEIVSWNKLDAEKMTTEMLLDFAQQYIDSRGRDGQYLISLHEDENRHPHIHIASSGLKYKTGMAHRLTRTGLSTLKDNIEKFQAMRFPELSFSSPNHSANRGYKSDKEYFLEKRKNERASAKEMLREQVATLHTQATNQQEFLELLRDAGLHHYERNGVPTGIVHEDIKFRFSRMDIPMDTLAIDRTQEQIALQQIQDIRKRRYEMDRDDMDMTRYVHINPQSLFE